MPAAEEGAEGTTSRDLSRDEVLQGIKDLLRADGAWGTEVAASLDRLPTTRELSFPSSVMIGWLGATVVEVIGVVLVVTRSLSPDATCPEPANARRTSVPRAAEGL